MNDLTQKPVLEQPLLGAHFSIAKGLQNALYTAQRYGCNALQLFTKNARTWKERRLTDEEVALFKKAAAETGITAIASHTSYLINLAAADPKSRARSKEALTRELLRSSELGIAYVVLHPGSHKNQNIDEAMTQIVDNINQIFDTNPAITSRLLLETTAGQGKSIGHRFEQIAILLDRVNCKDKIGVCLDTAHIFAAGYDLRQAASFDETMAGFDGIIGLENLNLIHLNDCKKDLGSRIDRHAHIGLGKIGRSGFGLIMNDERLKDVPKILETPKLEDGRDMDQVNLDFLRSLVKTKR
jgi:deoxyribonuclease IV